MAGNNSKPVQLIKKEGKSHRTKKELEHRDKMEQSLYTGFDFKESEAVKSDVIAHKEFLRLKKLYKQIEFVDGLDQQMINRYCLLISQEDGYRLQFDRLNERLVNVDTFEQEAVIYETMNKAATKLNQIRDMILKLEDRLFLNPTARMKAIPKQPLEDEKGKSPMAVFMDKKFGNA